jgi:hypothetical protein
MSHKVDRFARKLTLGSLALACSLVMASKALAAPSDELTHAIQATGAHNIKEAPVDQFRRAFISVLVGKKERDFPLYVSAAVKLRPGLADKIVVSALNICRLNTHGKNHQIPCDIIGRIINAAVTANPDAAEAIVRAAISSEPYARSCIVAAAIAAAPDQELTIRRAASENESIAFLQAHGAGNINPVDLAAEEPVTSQEQPPNGP